MWLICVHWAHAFVWVWSMYISWRSQNKFFSLRLYLFLLVIYCYCICNMYVPCIVASVSYYILCFAIPFSPNELVHLRIFFAGTFGLLTCKWSRKLRFFGRFIWLKWIVKCAAHGNNSIFDASVWSFSAKESKRLFNKVKDEAIEGRSLGFPLKHWIIINQLIDLRHHWILLSEC